jgi:hypothetical protein
LGRPGAERRERKLGNQRVGDGNLLRGAQSSTLTERWNGTKWKVVASPNPGAHSNSLNAISADAANDAWVAGQDNNRPGGFKNLLEHWDGSTWTAS